VRQRGARCSRRFSVAQLLQSASRRSFCLPLFTAISSVLLPPLLGLSPKSLSSEAAGPRRFQAANFVTEACVYGGMILHHYGHLIFETLSRSLVSETP
jgi:hypothetical protein